jgi:LacI family transcriptional regulator
MAKAYNLKDVAKLAEVSLGTASKVINNIYVKPELRLRVEAAMKTLDYTPNAIARSLKANTTNSIGIMIPDISSPVVGKVLKGIENKGREAGYSLLIYQTAMDSKVEEEAIDTFLRNKVDGIIYAGNTVTDHIASKLRGTKVPVVFVMTDYPDKSFSSVRIDNESAAYTAVDYLCSSGHKKILMLAGKPDDPNAGVPRLEGYKSALKAHHIIMDNQLVLSGNYSLNRGYTDMKRVLSEALDFTAVFAVSDEVAIGAVKALTEAGMSVPKDVSIIGFDGIDMVDFVTPALATISQPFYQLGEESANVLINRLKFGKGNVSLIFPHQLKKNGSVSII